MDLIHIFQLMLHGGMSKWVKNAQNVETIFSECDYITLHAPSTKETKGIINQESIAMMKDGVRILNFARGGFSQCTRCFDCY